MQAKRTLGGKRIFLAHGTDNENRDQLLRALQSFGLDVVVLSREKVTGATTLIEKFERVANTCNYAVALLTPDDKHFEDLNGDERYKARQNVLIELGWFMAHIGRENTFIVVVGDVDIPSDIVGIEVLMAGDSIAGSKDRLVQFFKSIARSEASA